ncbi:MAG: hypothetical protein ACI909_004364, partial [Planctomycetota bacterium]
MSSELFYLLRLCIRHQLWSFEKEHGAGTDEKRYCQDDEVGRLLPLQTNENAADGWTNDGA